MDAFCFFHTDWIPWAFLSGICILPLYLCALSLGIPPAQILGREGKSETLGSKCECV